MECFTRLKKNNIRNVIIQKGRELISVKDRYPQYCKSSYVIRKFHKYFGQ